MTATDVRSAFPAPVLTPVLDPSDLPAASRAGWLREYARLLVGLDTAVLLAASLCGVLLRFGTGGASDIWGVPYAVGSLLLVPVWIATLALSRCYETRFLGSGTEEFKRVANASFRVVAVVVFLLYATRTDLSRGFLAIALFAGMLGVVAARYGARLVLQAQRRRGRCVHAVVVVGPAAQALEMTTMLQSQPMSGLRVVGACVTGDALGYSRETLVPVLGSLTDVVPVLEQLRADTVVVAKGPGIGPDDLRQLAYELEGTGVDLLVSPALTNVAGTRIQWRSMPGLALLHIDEPELSGSRRLVKAVFDRSVALALLLLALPVLAACVVAIRLTSPGAALFRQERAGKDGQTFRIWKLRTMHVDAETRLTELQERNVHREGGVLFKIHDDPRVTPVGRFLRRYSLDELPQLVNVLKGDMSLVGPRPPLPHEVARYQGHVHRRLLVRPGMTGLWQVNGRSDLAWEDAVCLDLHYVENWSLGLDIAVLAKTAVAVLRSSGAY